MNMEMDAIWRMRNEVEAYLRAELDAVRNERDTLRALYRRHEDAVRAESAEAIGAHAKIANDALRERDFEKNQRDLRHAAYLDEVERARLLEAERDAAREELTSTVAMKRALKAEAERDAARAELERLQWINLADRLRFQNRISEIMRERCAKIAEEMGKAVDCEGENIAEAIRELPL